MYSKNYYMYMCIIEISYSYTSMYTKYYYMYMSIIEISYSYTSMSVYHLS